MTAVTPGTGPGFGDRSASRFTLARVVPPLVVVAVGFALRASYRGAEAQASAIVANVFGAKTVEVAGSSSVLIIPRVGLPFYALVSFGCSSISVLLAFSFLALVFMRSSLTRRLCGAVAVAFILFVVNVSRIGAVVAIGQRYGLRRMAQAHDWFGTAVTLLGGVLAAVALFAIAAMPERRDRNRTADPHA